MDFQYSRHVYSALSILLDFSPLFRFQTNRAIFFFLIFFSILKHVKKNVFFLLLSAAKMEYCVT